MHQLVRLAAAVAIGFPAAAPAATVELRFSPQPSRIVESRLTTLLVQRVDLKGDDELIARHRAQGTTFPNTIRTQSRLAFTQRSEAIEEDGSFSFQLEYLDSGSSSSNDIGLPVPIGDPAANLVGTVVHGRVSSDGSVDYLNHRSSRVSSLSDSEIAAILRSTFSAMAKLDRVKLKVGESAIQDFHLAIPLAGIEPIGVTMESTYKLTEVTADDARFSVQTRFSVGDFPNGAEVTLTGSGYGAMTYDRRLMTMTSSSTIMRLTLEVKMNGLELRSDMNGRVVTETAVTPR